MLIFMVMGDEEKGVIEEKKLKRVFEARGLSRMLGVRILSADVRLKLSYDEEGNFVGSSFPAHIEIRNGRARWVIG